MSSILHLGEFKENETISLNDIQCGKRIKLLYYFIYFNLSLHFAVSAAAGILFFEPRIVRTGVFAH